MKNRVTLVALSLGLLLFAPSLKAQKGADNSKRIKLIYENINKVFREDKTGLYIETNGTKNGNPHSYLWPVCALIQAVNELEVLEPKKDYMSPIVKTIDKYYNESPPAAAYQDYVRAERKSDRFFDDNQWIAIAYLDAYNRNKNPRYLEVSKMIYKFMMTGYDTVAGGGLYWKEKDFTTKNTCSNGPGILVALQLYKITQDKEYLNTALSLYNWSNMHLRSREGLFFDAIKIPSLRIDKAFYTYNTGTMLQSNVLLYTITGEEKYLREAKTIAVAGKRHFYRNNKLPGHYWFNSVMMRGYQELYNIDKNRDWVQFFMDEADRVWKEERDSKNLIGKNEVKTLIDQAGMLEIYARVEQLKKQSK